MLTITITPEMVKSIHAEIYSESDNYVELTDEQAEEFLRDTSEQIEEEVNTVLWESISEYEEFWIDKDNDELSEGEDDEETDEAVE